MSDQTDARDPSSPDHAPNLALPSDQESDDDLRRTRPRLAVPADLLTDGQPPTEKLPMHGVDGERESELPTPPHGTPAGN